MEIEKKTDFAVITTISKDKQLVSRPMSTQDDLEDSWIYFFTEKDSEKVDEIKNDPSIVLLKVKPDIAEYWESHGLDKSALEVITSKFKDNKPDLGENETLDI